MEVVNFRGGSIQKNHLFLEMKQNIRDCSIPSLAPTSRFKKKRVKFKSTSSGKLNSKMANLKAKNSLKGKCEYLKTLFGRLPEEFKFYLKFELKRAEFENCKTKFKELKSSKIRSTFGGSKNVDKQLEELLQHLYNIIRELNTIGRFKITQSQQHGTGTNFRLGRFHVAFVGFISVADFGRERAQGDSAQTAHKYGEFFELAVEENDPFSADSRTTISEIVPERVRRRRIRVRVRLHDSGNRGGLDGHGRERRHDDDRHHQRRLDRGNEERAGENQHTDQDAEFGERGKQGNRVTGGGGRARGSD